MYITLLAFHSLIRWLVLASLLFSIYRAYTGWLHNKPFTSIDNKIRTGTVTIAHIQLVVGLGLYIISPIVAYFFAGFPEVIHQREIRFFGMEHSTMMLSAMVLITIGSAKAKRKTTDEEKFKTLAIWFSTALFIIFTSIPWAFSPFTTRPYFRPF
ncbi:MAG: hypothetical protein ACO1N7_04285 [Sphingobacteriaceae bacterium]